MHQMRRYYSTWRRLLWRSLPSTYYDMYLNDMRACDLLITIGTSLKVYPFASLVNLVPHKTPRLFINLQAAGPFSLERNETSYRDLCVLGDCDQTIVELCDLLGWKDLLYELYNSR